jgi:formylmethanofuran dehydrogenase subunit D
MQEVRLSVRKRAYPSQGRVRFNIAHLADIGILEGDRVDLINEATKKSVTTAVIADTMVRQGQIRISEEDLKILGLQEDEDVLVRKAQPLQEKIKKAAAEANAALTKGVDSLDKATRKTAVEVKAEAGKAAEGLKKGTKKASDSIGKAAKKTAGDVKKAVKKVKGDDTL